MGARPDRRRSTWKPKVVSSSTAGPSPRWRDRPAMHLDQARRGLAGADDDEQAHAVRSVVSGCPGWPPGSAGRRRGVPGAGRAGRGRRRVPAHLAVRQRGQRLLDRGARAGLRSPSSGAGCSPTAGTSSTGTPMTGYQRAGSPSKSDRTMSRWCSRASRAADSAAGQLDQVGQRRLDALGGPVGVRGGDEAGDVREPDAVEPGGRQRGPALLERREPSRGRSQPPSTQATAAATPGCRAASDSTTLPPHDCPATTGPRRPNVPASAARSSAFVSVSYPPGGCCERP